MMRLFVVLIMLVSFPVYAQENILTVDLAQDSVDITTGFDGAYLSLFGVKYNGGQVAVVIKGPTSDALVRKKESVGGMWMNRSSLRFRDVPQFYYFALSDS